MSNATNQSIGEIKEFLKSANGLEFQSITQADRNEWVQSVLMAHRYKSCARADKGLLKQYIQKMTGLSRAQDTRLIAKYIKRGTLKETTNNPPHRNRFKKIYSFEDIALLAKVDNAHECLSGPATIEILKREHAKFNKSEYANLKNISVAHLYRLRQTTRYREKVKIFSKTNPTKVPIGERRKGEPNGEPGYLCVDTVHQGDKDGAKGVYHVNCTDMVTQYEYIGAVEAISESNMEKILADLIARFPFNIIEFHSDNGGEYINKIVAKLLNKLLIKQTKSRPRHSNDNGLAETKNGSIIRKHLGYIHIPRNKAGVVNAYYKNFFNDYLNYHRPCGFSETKTDKKGKEIKYYPQENYQTPYEKLKSLPNAENYLKQGMMFTELDTKANATSDTEYAELLQKEKIKMFKTVFNRS